MLTAVNGGSGLLIFVPPNAGDSDELSLSLSMVIRQSLPNRLASSTGRSLSRGERVCGVGQRLLKRLQPGCVQRSVTYKSPNAAPAVVIAASVRRRPPPGNWPWLWRRAWLVWCARWWASTQMRTARTRPASPTMIDEEPRAGGRSRKATRAPGVGSAARPGWQSLDGVGHVDDLGLRAERLLPGPDGRTALRMALTAAEMILETAHQSAQMAMRATAPGMLATQ